MKNHKQRVKERRNIKSSKPKKAKLKKYILLSFLSLVVAFILFRVFFVKKTEMNAVVSVVNITKVSEAGSNTYYRYGRGSHSFVLKYPAIYKIEAVSEDNEDIIFYTTEPDKYYCNGKFAIRYTVEKIFNKTTIKNVEKLSY